MPDKPKMQLWGEDTEWTCEWAADDAAQRQRVAVLRGHTNMDGVAGQDWPTFLPWANVETSFRDDTHKPSMHWAMTISCPTVSQAWASGPLKGSSSARLNLVGKRWGKTVYTRSGIPVSKSRFVKRDVDFAICTMVDRSNLTTAEYLKPWAQYHVGVGFTQLLVYVEEKDTSWVEDALRSFIKKDQVIIVPFYFGNISDKKDFLLQGAMENHCLYQARGMAKWIAHMDVDEYFDFLRSNVTIRDYPLPKSDSPDVAVLVRNQFRGILQKKLRDHRLDEPYPCHIDGGSQDIQEVTHRSKVIMRPEYIDALFPHWVVKQAGYSEVHPDPLTELRLNHFKLCETSGDGCWAKATWNRKKELAYDSEWHSRCSDALAAGQ